MPIGARVRVEARDVIPDEIAKIALWNGNALDPGTEQFQDWIVRINAADY
jgi:hypothetical protein